MTKNNLDNPIFLFILLIVISTINIISSIHFFLILFAGILFLSFYITLKNRYMYSLTFVIIAFLLIEINSGFPPLSLTLLSFFIYIFVIPKTDNLISYNSLNYYLYIGVFYLGLTILWAFLDNMPENTVFVLIFNLFVDLIFFGVFIWLLDWILSL